MDEQKGDPEVASIFSDDCSQREYPVFYPLRLLERFGSCGRYTRVVVGGVCMA